MGSNRKPDVHAKAKPGTSKQHFCVKQATKKRQHKWIQTKDRSERVRDALNRDADLLYGVLETPSTSPSTFPQGDSVVSLAESMQGLGRL